ncbi:MAG: serine hydrolase [Microbacteriaceae bacterium]
MTELSRVRERSARVKLSGGGRHESVVRVARFAGTFSALGQLAYEGAEVSASVLDLHTGAALVSIDDRIVLPTASIGKVLLLIEVSALLTARDFSGYGILDKTPRDLVGDSGVWQHMQAPALPVADLATLVGATSDNMATNLLLSRVGLEAVRKRSESLGLSRTALLDLVRDKRGPDDAPQLSVGSTAELSWLFGALARGEIVDPVTSQRVMGWLSLNCDLSMVASAFGLDPLAHRLPDHDTLVVNKTGTDVGVRAEVGALRGARASLSYAVSIHFSDDELTSRLKVLAAMRTVGEELLDYVH